MFQPVELRFRLVTSERIVFQNYMAHVHKDFAMKLFKADAEPDLPGHTDSAQIFASEFKLESNAICFTMSPDMNPVSQSLYEIVDVRTVITCIHVLHYFPAHSFAMSVSNCKDHI